MSKKALGKGLGAIISTTPVHTPEHEKTEITDIRRKDRINELDIELIKPNPDQPRTHFNEEAIKELAESIKSVGIIQPIIVRQQAGEYFLVAGERRLRASKEAGLKKIKSIIIETKEEEDNLTIALIENLQRRDLDPIEEAKAYKILVNRFKLKQNDVAAKVGKDRATVANALRLLNLDDQIQHAISDGRISVGHAKVLLAAPEDRQVALFREILSSGLSVRELEKKIEADKPDTAKDAKEKHKDAHLRKLEEELMSVLGTKVEIKHSGSGGTITINYYSLDDFDRIVDLIKK